MKTRAAFSVPLSIVTPTSGATRAVHPSSTAQDDYVATYPECLLGGGRACLIV